MVKGASDPVDVVILGPDHLDSFAANIADGFEDLGIRARVLDPFATLGRSAYSRWGTATRRIIDEVDVVRDRLFDRPVADALERLDPRLVLSIWGYFDPVQVTRWRRRTPRSTWALWYPDAHSNLGAHRTLLAPYDHFFFKDPYLVDLFAGRAGLPAHYLADACNPRFHRPPLAGSPAGMPTCDVVMIGSLYAYRLLVMEGLPTDIDLRIYGNPPAALPARFARFADAHVGRLVFGAEKAKAFADARIVLNTMHYAEVCGVNNRLFEATGSGGFVLSHTNAGLARYFEPGLEVAVFETKAELGEAVRHYLGDPEARAAIASAGALRTHRDHTYPVRLRDLIQTCGLGGEAAFANPSVRP